MYRPVVLLAVLLTLTVSVKAADRPNVVFILADDLGWTDLGCQGSKYYESPNIDKLAAQGLRCTSGYTCGPNCQPTRAALMSGQYGPRTGVYTVGNIDRFNWKSRPLRPVDNVEQLPADRTTLGEMMKAAGYSTALFGKWHLGQMGAFHPSRRGFDEAITSMGKHFHFATQPKVEVPEGAYLADWLTDRAVDFIARNKTKPFFLCLHHFGVHSPYEAKPELIRKFQNRPGVGGHNDPTYAAMIWSVDESVGRILKALENHGLGERTLVVFTSDNGGVGGYVREGLKQAGDRTDNAPLRGGKGMLYEGGIRVPYVFRWTGTIKPGTTSDEPITSVDLFPTLLEISGGKAPEKQVLDGTSYLPLLRGEKATLGREAIYWHFPGYLGAGQGTWRTTPAGAIRSGDWKLLEFFEDGKVELYNLKDDPGEKKNLAEASRPQREELLRKLSNWRTGIKAPIPGKNRQTGCAIEYIMDRGQRFAIVGCDDIQNGESAKPL